RVANELLANTRVRVQFVYDIFALRIRRPVALDEHVGVFAYCELLDGPEKRLKIARTVGNLVVVPCNGGLSRQIRNELLVVAVAPKKLSEVQNRRQQHEPVDLHARVLQIVREAARARRSIAFT